MNQGTPHSYKMLIGIWQVCVLAHWSAVCMSEQQHGFDVNFCMLFVLEKWTFMSVRANTSEFVNVGGGGGRGRNWGLV